jgi:hypothetical protein
LEILSTNFCNKISETETPRRHPNLLGPRPALAAFDAFVEAALECLSNIATLRLPSRTLKHLRTTNVIELGEAAEKSWRRFNGHNHLPKIVLGERKHNLSRLPPQHVFVATEAIEGARAVSV